MNTQTLILIDRKNWAAQSSLVTALARAYATSFWGAAWKELLAVRDPSGRVLQQFGTFDERGVIFPETLPLIERTGISADDSTWPLRLWEAADGGELTTEEGERVSPYWTLAAAMQELHRFVAPREHNGYGGEILVIEQARVIVGFTAYACARSGVGRVVADRRFPTKRLHVPIECDEPTNLTVGELLANRYSGDLVFGTFLDHAVSEAYRGSGLGSHLFDARLNRLVELGADVVFGRTMVTAPRQYVGNYLARGLVPIAADGTDAFSRAKHYFAAARKEIRPRPLRRC